MPKQPPLEVIMPPNMLKAKLGRTAVGLDMGALRRAEAAMDDLKTEFSDWMNSDVARLNKARDDYAADPSDANRAALYRASHDVRGQALTFEFPLAARIAASLCKMMDAHVRASQKLVDAHVSAIRIIVSQSLKAADDATALALAEELEAQVAELAQS